MADAKEVSAEAAKALVEAILKQSELLGSWSLAVFGAAILIIVWYVQRQLDEKQNSHQMEIIGRCHSRLPSLFHSSDVCCVWNSG